MEVVVSEGRAASGAHGGWRRWMGAGACCVGQLGWQSWVLAAGHGTSGSGLLLSRGALSPGARFPS